MTRLAEQWRSVLVSALAVGLGFLAIVETADMSELGRVFPMTASLVAIAAGLGVMAQVVLRRAPALRNRDGAEFARAGLLSVTLLIWALALDPLGFTPTCAIAMVLVAVIARREPMSVTSVLYHALAGVGLVVGFSVLLGQVLNVRLP